MTRKTWIVTVEKQNAAPEIFEHVSARKKIGQIEEYLCDLYEHLVETDHSETDVAFDQDELKPFITRASGTEIRLEKVPYILRAVLVEAYPLPQGEG